MGIITMNTRDIHKILAADMFVHRFNFKVLARDQLPTHIDRTKPAAFIINTDPSDRPGLHWVGLYFDGLGHFEYVDSFGLPPLHDEIETLIAHNTTQPLTYNTRGLQDILSNTCGLYVLYFILIKSRGGSMRRVVTPFTTSHRQRVNDRVVYRLVRPWLVRSGFIGRYIGGRRL